jgi:hypothetical protein
MAKQLQVYTTVSGLYRRLVAGSAVRSAGVWRTMRRIWICENGTWVLLEEWVAPGVSPPSVSAHASGSYAHAEWQIINDMDDIRFGYGVQVDWYDADTNQAILGATEYVGQNAGTTSPRDFSGEVGVTQVYATVHYTNNYGPGPAAFTNTVFIGGV